VTAFLWHLARALGLGALALFAWAFGHALIG
jgi:hypothetical protein